MRSQVRFLLAPLEPLLRRGFCCFRVVVSVVLQRKPACPGCSFAMSLLTLDSTATFCGLGRENRSKSAHRADPQRDAGLSTLGNVVWFIVGGWYLALAHLVVAIFLALTIIGFPLAIASAKMAGLALAPFGKKIVPRSSLGATSTVTVVSSIG